MNAPTEYENLPLAGIRVVEVSSFVAAPLCGMTLAQLGAEVIRVDPLHGGPDYARWPVTSDGASIYWTGLNKGKRSVVLDLKSAGGQSLVRELITESGPEGGVVLTNTSGREWLSYDSLARLRPDLIHLEIHGRGDRSTGVDYTVNAATGFPSITGPADHDGPVNHALPVWDVTCGLYAALALTSAVRHRDRTGRGTALTVALENVALATAGNLGFLTEAQVNGVPRERIGNDIYGQYGHDFATRDGARFMVVTLTPRHFRELSDATQTSGAIAGIEESLGVDFDREADRYRYRQVLHGLFGDWFGRHTAAEVTESLAQTSVLHERYRDFVELATDKRVTANPLFRPMNQPGVGSYDAAGLPVTFDGIHPPAVPAPFGAADTSAVLRDRLGLSDADVAELVESRAVRTDPFLPPRHQEQQ